MSTPAHNFAWPFEDKYLRRLRKDSNDLLKTVEMIRQIYSNVIQRYSLCFASWATDLMLQRRDGAAIADMIKQKIVSINLCYKDYIPYADLIGMKFQELSVYYPYRSSSPFLVNVVKDIVEYNSRLHDFTHNFFERHKEFEELLEATAKITNS